MKIGSAVLGTGEKLLDRALCVAGAVIFSQAPEFMQQYLQRLGEVVNLPVRFGKIEA